MHGLRGADDDGVPGHDEFEQLYVRGRLRLVGLRLQCLCGRILQKCHREPRLYYMRAQQQFAFWEYALFELLVRGRIHWFERRLLLGL